MNSTITAACSKIVYERAPTYHGCTREEGHSGECWCKCANCMLHPIESDFNGVLNEAWLERHTWTHTEPGFWPQKTTRVVSVDAIEQLMGLVLKERIRNG